MTYAEFKATVELVKYRPCHVLTVRLERYGRDPLGPEVIATGPSDFLVVTLEAEVLCAEKKDGSTVRINSQSRLALAYVEGWKREDVLKWLYSEVIMGFERHEAGEWFRFWPPAALKTLTP